MATKEAKRRKTPREAPDLAKQQTTEALQNGEETVGRIEDEAREVAGRTMLREAPYAGIGLGHVVAETVRNLDATSLPERLRRAPGAVTSKVGEMGTNVKVSYLALAARGRALRLSSTGDELSGEMRRQTKAVGGLAKDTATATRDVASETVVQASDVASETVEQASDTAAATGGRVKGAVGRLRRAANRTTEPAGGHEEDVDGPAAETSEVAMGAGTGPLEKRTVAQLRECASELGIEARSSMKKKELIRAIRDAT